MENIIYKIEKKIVMRSIKIWYKIHYRPIVLGSENIPKDGPVIFCGNHRSFADAPLIVITAKRDIKFLAKKELYDNKFFAHLGKVFDEIPVKRDEKDIAAIKKTLKVLKSGGCIGIFPEGTRNGLAKGEKVKDGVAFFAIMSGAKVVPCGIKGGAKGNKRLVITYGKPLDYSKYTGNKDKEVIEKVTNEIMDNIILLTK